VQLSEPARTFLEAARSAAMITLRRDGSPHAVRVGVALVDGKVWSSGTADRVRTRHLRRDPRATLIVYGAGREALSIDATVNILDGPDVPELSWKLFSVMQRGMTPPPPPEHLMWYGKLKAREDFLRAMIDERRLIYEFDVIREYGLQR
jgi:pyridoxamine 5'-phosphate oxidase-like protein